MLMLWITEETFSFAFEILTAERIVDLVAVFEDGKFLMTRNF